LFDKIWIGLLFGIFFTRSALHSFNSSLGVNEGVNVSLRDQSSTLRSKSTQAFIQDGLKHCEETQNCTQKQTVRKLYANCTQKQTLTYAGLRCRRWHRQPDVPVQERDRRRQGQDHKLRKWRMRSHTPGAHPTT
jgi:hypothetical protein